MENEMQQKYYIRLRAIAEEHHLDVLYRSSDYEDVRIVNYNVMRPALQLVGFYEYFEPDRVRLWGKSESAFLATLPEGRQYEVVNRLFSRGIPVLILSNGVEAPPVILDAAKRWNVTLLHTDTDTSEASSRISATLRAALSPRVTVHGVLVEVYGEGLLITGDSGIGKSEVALELVKRGHRLVADDAVEIRRTNRGMLEGSAPKIIRYLMELRGVGLIDVRRLFGVGSVIPRHKIDLVVDFVPWQENTEYDRMGLEDDSITYLEVPVPKITVPVAAARNLAIILEVAAMNNRMKSLGYNTAREFLAHYDESISSGNEEDFYS